MRFGTRSAEGRMTQSTRREFLQTSSWAGLGLFAAGCAPKVSDFAQKPGRRVVVIGGGWGGTSAAKYVRLADPSIEVILLEPNKEFVSCPFSNLVLSGVRTIESLTFNYDRLRAQGVKVLHETATMIELGDKVKYDVLNLIPPQRAGTIAVTADLVGADKRWCEVNHLTYESVKHKNVHVIGDSTIGLPVPTSGNIANAMGKICAVAVVHLLNGKEVPSMAPGNTCYSWVNDREAIAVVNAYKIEGGKVVQIEQKLTPSQSAEWAQHADGWARSIWQDILA